MNFSLERLEIYSTLVNLSPVDLPIGESVVDIRQYLCWTSANWRLSTELSPIHSVKFRQLLAKVKFGELPESRASTSVKFNSFSHVH